MTRTYYCSSSIDCSISFLIKGIGRYNCLLKSFFIFVFIFVLSPYLKASTFIPSSDSTENHSVDFSEMTPLGKNSKTSLFWDGRMIYGEDGTNIYLSDVFPDSIEDGKMMLMQYSGVISSSIDADSIYGSGILELQSILPTKDTSFAIRNSNESDNYIYSINDIDFDVSITDIPIGSPYRVNILSYISTHLYHLLLGLENESSDEEISPTFALYVPNDNTNIKDIEDYYAFHFNEFCYAQGIEWAPFIYIYSFEKALESKNYVTYYECYHNRVGAGSIWGYGTKSYVTFDKKNGHVINLEDIFDLEYECILAYLLKKDLNDQGVNPFVIYPRAEQVALAQNGLVFSYEPWEVAPPNSFIFNSFIHYDDLADLMKQNIKSFMNLKSDFHEAIVVRNDNNASSDSHNIVLFQSSGEAKAKLRKVENNLPISSLWHIGYGLESATIDQLASLHDSLLADGNKKEATILYKFIEQKNNEFRMDSVDTLFSDDDDWATKAMEKANTFFQKKEWDMATEHLLIALVFMLSNNDEDNDTHDSYTIPNNLLDYLKYDGNSGRNQYLDCVTLLGDIEMQNDYTEQATGYYKRAASVLSYLLTKKYQESFSQTRGKFWDFYSSWSMNKLPAIAFEANDDTLKMAAYNATLMGKGLKLNTTRAERQAIYDNNDTILINYLQNEEHLKIQLLELTDSIKYLKKCLRSMRPKSPSLEKHLDSLQVAQSEITDQLSQVISEKYQLLEERWQFHQNIDIKWEDVKNELNEDELAIEFVYGYNNHDTTYYAMCIKQSTQFPLIIRLFNQRVLPNVSSSSQNLKKLYNLVWKPLNALLKGINKVYFSPAGLLHDFSIESAINPSGTVMSQEYEIFRLSSTGVLSTKRIKAYDSFSDKAAALFGGLKYDNDEGFLERDRKRYKTEDRGNITSSTTDYQIPTDYITNKKKHFTYLPGTRLEVNAIKNVIDGANLYNEVSVYQDTIGTENLFKSLSGKHLKLIHIATHGGFDEIDDTPQAVGDIDDNTLRRAFLALSGANSNDSNHASNDGVADGLEISAMNLSGLQLVVLSACESGRGNLSNEGVIGLQNAFKKAGAQTLMMSLRRVHDEATRLLMTDFYSNIAAGMSIINAFTKAQSSLRNYKNGVYSDPYYWANFVILDAI